MMNLEKNMVQAYKAYVKTGNANKSAKFFTVVATMLDKAIDTRKEEIKALKEKEADLKLIYKVEYALNIDSNNLKDAQSREDYAENYIQGLLNFDFESHGSKGHSIVSLEKAIKKLNNEVTTYTDLKDFLMHLVAPIDEIESED